MLLSIYTDSAMVVSSKTVNGMCKTQGKNVHEVVERRKKCWMLVGTKWVSGICAGCRRNGYC